KLDWVSDLIIPRLNYWDHNLVFSSFSEKKAKIIESIPLPLAPQSDKLIWSREHSKVFYVRSGYMSLVEPLNMDIIEQNTGGNTVAHTMAAEGMKSSKDRFWFEDALVRAIDLVASDLQIMQPP
ncbi:hypothetical protein Gohar_020721, partial [Gossypium harknessii]|nr:hypothetical protein [Gossypium harknessii]